MEARKGARKEERKEGREGRREGISSNLFTMERVNYSTSNIRETINTTT